MQRNNYGKIVWDWLSITVATAIVSASVFFFLVPSQVPVGSVSSLAMVLGVVIPLPISAITMILNVALLLLGFLFIGREFGAKTVYTSLLMPVFLAVFEWIFPGYTSLMRDPVLDMICFIFLADLGLSMLFNRNASSGGLDIIAKFLNKYLRMDLGHAMSLSGMCVALSAAFVYDAKTVVLSVLGTYINGLVLDHFIFGANIFNFDQLGSKDSNARYKSLFGTLFNSATVAFYWAPLEMKLGEPRFDSEFWDSEEFWNNVKYPKLQPHWRRPAVGNIVDFCLDKNIRIHGHPLVWGNRKWHYPEKMIFDKFASPEEMAFFKKYSKNNLDCSTYAFSEEYKKMPQSELEKRFGNISKAMAELIEIRVREIAKRFADKVDSWDVVNESSEDFAAGVLIPGSGASKSRYGIMEADYAFNAFRLAQKYLPKSAALNINDYNMKPDYVKQVEDLPQTNVQIHIQKYL